MNCAEMSFQINIPSRKALRDLDEDSALIENKIKKFHEYF
jgi:hypothetical protein